MVIRVVARSVAAEIVAPPELEVRGRLRFRGRLFTMLIKASVVKEGGPI